MIDIQILYRISILKLARLLGEIFNFVINWTSEANLIPDRLYMMITDCSILRINKNIYLILSFEY